MRGVVARLVTYHDRQDHRTHSLDRIHLALGMKIVAVVVEQLALCEKRRHCPPRGSEATTRTCDLV